MSRPPPPSGGTVATAIAAFLTYDFLFTNPRLSLAVADPREVLDLVLFLFVALAIGRLVATQHARADQDWNAAVLPGSVDGTINSLTNGNHAGFRALVRSLALDYADQVEYDHASFNASF